MKLLLGDGRGEMVDGRALCIRTNLAQMGSVQYSLFPWMHGGVIRLLRKHQRSGRNINNTLNWRQKALGSGNLVLEAS